MLYIDRKLEFYIGYAADEECWILVSIPAAAREVLGMSSGNLTELPITVSEIEQMLEKDIVCERFARLGTGTWIIILEAIENQVEKIKGSIGD